MIPRQPSSRLFVAFIRGVDLHEKYDEIAGAAITDDGYSLRVVSLLARVCALNSAR